ncbi:MAG TPA: hemolysin family protein [Cyclobacteriaceae bacterium]
MNLYLVLLIAISLLLLAFFQGAGTAFPLARKLQGSGHNLSGRILSIVTSNRTHFTGTIVTGSTISLVLYGLFMAQLLEPQLRNYLPQFLNTNSAILILQIILSTILVLFTAEALPNLMLTLHPQRMVSWLAIPFFVLYILLFPFVFLIVSVSRLITTRMLHSTYSYEPSAHGLVNINNFTRHTAQQAHAQVAEMDTKIIHNALEFKTVLVRECMIPRTEIIAVEQNEGIERLREAFVESGHSKIIVYKNTIDDVIGYCHSSALFRKPRTIEEILTPIIIVPETTLANELMIKFINERKSLAVVLDEFGGTSGIVSMEDVIEEILGDIEDEHDADNLIEQKIDENTYLLSARLEIDYLNDAYHWNLPEGDYETLSGLILTLTEDIPEPGEKVLLPPYQFTIQSTLENRIDVVKLIIGAPSQ